MVGGRRGEGGCVGGRRSTGDRGFGAGFGGEGGELTAGLGGHDGVRVDYVYASEGNALRKTEEDEEAEKGRTDGRAGLPCSDERLWIPVNANEKENSVNSPSPQ